MWSRLSNVVNCVQGKGTGLSQAKTAAHEAALGLALKVLRLRSNTDHAGPLQLLWAGLGKTDTPQGVVPADSAHVVHALGLLSLLGGLTAVNNSTLAGPDAVLVKRPCQGPLDGVQTEVPDDGPDPRSNDVVPEQPGTHCLLF